MDFCSPFIEPVMSCLMNPLMNHIKYLVKARTKVDNMANKLEKLRALRLDLNNIIEDAEREFKQSTEEVNLWLKTVGMAENEVVTIKNEYENRRCLLFGDFSLNCCLIYKCGKRATKVYEKMVELETQRGAFSSITTMQPPGHGRALPMDSEPVGLIDLQVETIRNHIIDDAVRIIGIHGMGGVGKTTLLKKVHNGLQGDRLGIECIVWVVVSKEFQLEKIQSEVAKELRLTLNDRDDACGHARSIYNYLKDRSFLLLFDDVWKYINLVDDVGIPVPCSGTSSSNNRTMRIQKVILTTRLKEVCGKMRADKIVRVECLKQEEARALFKKTLGEENLQSNLAIHGHVEKVISECDGLPLALTVIARSMASKRSISEWEQAVKYLERSQANKILDEDNLDMNPRLKFSYDSLKNDDLRRCFLYCSLWPEDDNISNAELVRFCIANDVIKDFDSMSEAYDKGYCLIEDLKGACLLEDSSVDTCVKMHDVLRDLGLWIASDCGDNQNKWVVKSGNGLREAPLEAEKWDEAQVVSLMDNKIEELPCVTFKCPTLSILLLRYNSSLRKIHPNFFQNMCALTYLDLSFTDISELPESITMLARLRYLGLECTGKLEHIPPRMISRLKELQILNLYGSGVCRYLDCVGDAMENEVSGNTIGSKGRREVSVLEELECLPGGLKGLTIDVYSADILRRLTILSRVSIWFLWLKELKELSVLRLEHNILRSLQCLLVECCDNVEVLEFVTEICPIDIIHIDGLPKLKEILWSGVAPSVILHRLHWVEICRSHSLKSISWILRLPSLAVLKVFNCEGLECLVDKKDGNMTTVAFPSLKHLVLSYLPNLSRICGLQYGLPSLEYLRVVGCPKLKKFPFLSNMNSITKLQEIECDDEWWDELEWDDQSIKASLESIRTLPAWLHEKGNRSRAESMKPAVQADQMPAASKYNSRNPGRVERLLRERELRKFSRTFSLVEAEPDNSNSNGSDHK